MIYFKKIKNDDLFFTDAREKARQERHAALREACCINEDAASTRRILSSLSSGDAELVVNMAPGGANTLLFTACQTGRKDLVRTLLDHGADGRCHPVTRYSPLYISCYHGHKDVAEMLLTRFPELVQIHTVERWLPIHAACINGHTAVLDLLFQFNYPARVMRTFETTGKHGKKVKYRMPFDVNELDVTGQSVLYVACLLGNSQTVETILGLRVPQLPEDLPTPDEDNPETPLEEEKTLDPEPTSPTKRRISHGIQSIMSRLNLSRGSSAESDVTPEKEQIQQICPVDLDQYCNNGTETALHAAVKGRHYDIVQLLLKAGASANAVIRADDAIASSGDDEFCTGKSTALVEACRNRDVPMAELLLSHGARDDECRALGVAVRNKDEVLTARLLSIKANPDPEHKINKRAMTEEGAAFSPSTFSQLSNVLANFTTTYSSMFPSQPVMINWHNQRCRLSQLRPQWLTDAALQLNSRLKQNPRCHDVALYAITRLDVSSNSLVSLPAEIFRLTSLRYLNVAQNKIERLPDAEEVSGCANKRENYKRRSRSISTIRPEYRCPVLEELYAQDNRLEELPEVLFRLPSLVTLVVSNNKLQRLPYEMWRSPKLKELNASFNLLKDLPSESADERPDRLSVSSSDGQLSSHGSISETDDESVDITRCKARDRSVIQLEPKRPHLWCKSVEITEQILQDDDDDLHRHGKFSQLSSLNLAHNMFTSIPSPLACLAVNLTRLNMSFNSLRSMSHVTSYPSTLKQLDLSHNQITCWPSLPQVPRIHQPVSDPAVSCYAAVPPLPARPVSSTGPGGRPLSIRNSVLQSVCVHRRHLRLDALRTLVLAGNRLQRIQLTTDDDGFESDENTESTDQTCGKNRLMFPNLSMLDVSDNGLREVPPGIHELNNLSVLNISGNVDIGELPPQMGLLSRLWNLNTRGCQLHEPLRSMIASKKYKTMDVVGYLKSVLEDARPYARMKLMIVGVQGIGKTSLLEQLRHEGGSSRLSSHDDWARRMGNQTGTPSRVGQRNMSTVGVDIGDWTCERRGGNSRNSSRGPVVFRTWDFGGQREYYATHQYFLSKRSLYIVVWRILDGQRGISEILQWLVNIQARAPNSPVIIVGTHYDLVHERIPAQRSEQLQQVIRDRFINVVDAEKCGLPRVLDTIEVSCKTRHNIRLLCNLIYDTAFSLRPPGGKEPLLEQRVPASYLALEDVVGYVAAQRKQVGFDPVLSAAEYRTVVTAEMQFRGVRPFRDLSELHQATLFLHDNGVLLHYDDATLKDLYFLDPQWLCDMLAHVVTVREINPFARNGVMRLEDLRHVFKASGALGPVDHGRGYIVSLLNKFEVALTWDSRTLLIPSLLPSEEEVCTSGGNGAVTVRVPVRSRGRAVRGKKHVTVSPRSLQYVPPSSDSEAQLVTPVNETQSPITVCKRIADSSRSITRLLLMSYFPSGFWSRLVSRILADDTIVDIVRSYFVPPKESAQEPSVARALLELRAEWLLWQTGLLLRYGEATLLRMREVPRDFYSNYNGSGAQLIPSSPCYRQMKFRLRQDGIWCDVDLAGSSILEIHFPMDRLAVGDLEVPPATEPVTQLLALAVDHIDTLLEDWYPTLGTRFVHTSEGRFLVTRLVPCPDCLSLASEELFDWRSDEDHLDWRQEKISVRMSQESYTSEADSGVGGESRSSSRAPSVEGRLSEDERTLPVHYGWMVEECILAAHSSTRCVQCPSHGDIPLTRVSPDVIFLDLGERYLIRPDSVKRGRLLGRGAFGFVFRGTCKSRGSQAVVDVAMKMLQPVQPGAGARQSAIVAFRAAQGKWERDPLQYACKAYCTARQELAILLSLRHPNIVPLVGVCASPLSLVLDLAPRGALDGCLRHYRRSGARLASEPLRQLVLQTARAIEYLHRQRIIYRDLKSENVLVWQLPEPFDYSMNSDTHVKLADYGISRMTLPGGAKGFGGTEGFMAPEIMRHNGEEEYTEKVDCFSFGMYIYELLTLRQPFEGHESVKECILEGGRPPLNRRQTLVHPPHCLDLMVLCWAQNPKDRPSASQIVSIASAPEFSRLVDVIPLKHSATVAAATASPPLSNAGNACRELWLACANSRIDLLLTGGERGVFLQYHSFAAERRPTAACTISTNIWLGDCAGRIHAYSSTDCSKIFSVSLTTDDEEDERASVRCMTHAPSCKQVACALANGQLLLLDDSDGHILGELNVLGSPSVHALCAVSISGGISELWAGGARARLAVHSLVPSEVRNNPPELLEHREGNVLLEEDDTAAVLSVIAEGGDISSTDSVWTYVYPGCVVYQWDVSTRRVLNRLDCSKLVPCSESLKSIAIEEHLSPGRCQVTGLAVSKGDLYIGTTWGCLIVAERSTMRPVTVFRPYEEDVRFVVPLGEGSLVATAGRGYRSLLTRYTDSSLLNGEEPRRDCMFAMLWRADNWATI